MKDYAFRIVNVFAEERLGGNPLVVFEDGRGLDDATMQALALQFNLSETTFITPSERATVAVRIFTPTFEMPFAGHPTLGTAHVVRSLHEALDPSCRTAVTLEMRAGVIPVAAQGDEWTLEARAPRVREVDASADDLARMLGLDREDLLQRALWVDTGSEQLIVPLASTDAVRRVEPDARLIARHGSVATGRAMAYVYAWTDPGQVLARFFFSKQAAVVEDPGTGSACANLGGSLLALGRELPFSVTVDQGEAAGRRCKLGLSVDAERRIFVSGRVIEIARGVLTL